MKWLILVLGILSNASASVLIKVAMTNTSAPIQLSKPLSIIGNIPLVSGLSLYGLAFILYAVALTYLPLMNNNVDITIIGGGFFWLISC